MTAGATASPLPPGRWNHNTAFHQLALQHAPTTRSALDVGCGEGLLTRRLVRAGVPRVVGIDVDPRQIERARLAGAGDERLEYMEGDVMALLRAKRFDLVTCYATLHHLDLVPALERLRDLTSPGGRLVVVGLARSRSLVDVAYGLASVPAHAITARSRGLWEHGAPVADPVDSYGAVRAAAKRTLPGCRFRHRLYWRYSIEWTRPVSA